MKIVLKEVSKTYKEDIYKTVALDNISLEINKGDQIMIVGPSGSGKSSLLNIIGLLDRDYKGAYTINNDSIKNITLKDMAGYRNQTFAYIFQEYLLIENETIYENVRVPLLYSKINKREYDTTINDILTKVGLAHIADRKVKDLSGGERQRVAIARSLINNPDIILADEPTGALDSANREIILDILYNYAQDDKILLFVTHDLEKNRRGNQRVIKISEGRIFE